MAFGLFSGGATGRSSIGSLTEGADMSLSQVTFENCFDQKMIKCIIISEE